MIKRLFFCLLMLNNLVSNAQLIPQTIGSPNTSVTAKGNFNVDSVLGMPKRLVSPNRQKDTGSIYYRIADSTIRKWTGNAWRDIVGARQLNDSMIKIGDDTITIRGTGGGINQLTGDVTAGPGTGSQAATIANNAVTDAKIRQSAGLSVIGRSTNTTGNVADITAAVASTYLKRAAGNILWDSVDWAEIKNTPSVQNPGVYFSPAESVDPSFVVFAAGIAKTSNSYSQGNPITWDFLDHITAHNSSFYDSVTGSGSGIGVRFPTVKNVLNTTITPDETFATNMIFTGTSTGITGLAGPVIRPAVLNIRLTGNSTSSWSTSNGLGLLSRWSLSSFSSGGTSFNIVGPATTIDYDGINIQYIGTNNYHIRRVYSGLGIYNVRFYLVDEFGNDVTDNPTSSDEVVISAGAMAPVITDMGTWQPDNQFMDGFANFWIFGAYECWLVAAPTSSSSINVRWQTTYPSATNYKIYRATSLYGARTLVHTGTEGAFTDSGLSPGTLYWYFMVAVIGGVDTEITYFRTSTKD
jgi:hypothetical protein